MATIDRAGFVILLERTPSSKRWGWIDEHVSLAIWPQGILLFSQPPIILLPEDWKAMRLKFAGIVKDPFAPVLTVTASLYERIREADPWLQGINLDYGHYVS